MAVAMTIWIAAQVGGGADFFYALSTVSGSTRAWLWLSNLTSVTGGYSTLVVNIPELSRFSRHKGAQDWQLPVIPMFKVLVGALGIVSAAASQKLYNKTLWNPLDIVNQ